MTQDRQAWAFRRSAKHIEWKSVSQRRKCAFLTVKPLSGYVKMWLCRSQHPSLLEIAFSNTIPRLPLLFLHNVTIVEQEKIMRVSHTLTQTKILASNFSYIQTSTPGR
jgi:hypothetical protein